ncbi:MAG: sodium:calcium antiporter [Gammaproteobacteria bacterium]|nr:sodium:calcium antiporter [Gammaproteobacteria bacterium]
MSDYLALLLGVVFAGAGGELFVRGAVGLARWLRISPGIIGATVAAFATSSPELSVAISSALAGDPAIALGDGLGSNVVNVALILGAVLLISGIHAPRQSVKRDFPVALLVPVVTAALVVDGELSRIDGSLMLGMFLAWISATVIEARRQHSAAGQVLGEHKRGLAIAACVVGLAFLVSAGILIVRGAKGIAVDFGIDEFIVGATVVAIGTSAPELATSIVAKLRGHDEVGLGTILGSNIFNGLFIISVAAVIHPIAVAWREILIALVFGVVSLAFTIPPASGYIERRRGIALLMLYTAYLGVLFRWRTA